MARRDDDALSWGDDDPTLDPGVPDEADDWEDAGDAVLPAAASNRTVTAVVTNPDGTTSTREVVHPHADDRKQPRPAADAAAGPAPLGNVALVALGVLGGVYALFAVGWFLAGMRYQAWAALFLEPAGFVAAWLLATAAPVVWFVSVVVLARRRPVWLRLVLLLLGVVVLVPWPFLSTGVAA